MLLARLNGPGFNVLSPSNTPSVLCLPLCMSPRPMRTALVASHIPVLQPSDPINGTSAVPCSSRFRGQYLPPERRILSGGAFPRPTPESPVLQFSSHPQL
jgi:hypothetical protein